MSLMDEIKAQAVQDSACAAGVLIEAMGKGDKTDAMGALADLSIPTAQIFRALRSRGLMVTVGTLGRHRRGECACGRTG